MQNGSYVYSTEYAALSEPEPTKPRDENGTCPPAPAQPCKSRSKAVKILDLCGNQNGINKGDRGGKGRHTKVPALGRKISKYVRAYRQAAEIEIRVIKLRVEIQEGVERLQELQARERNYLGDLRQARQAAAAARAADSPGFGCTGIKREACSSPRSMSISPSPCKRAKACSPEQYMPVIHPAIHAPCPAHGAPYGSCAHDYE